MTAIVCARCNETKEGLDEPPMPGRTGEMIMQLTCQDCWNEWRELSPQLINHYGLNLGSPDHRRELRRVMREFLNLADPE